MDPKVAFFFYLAAVACFVVAAFGGVRRFAPRRTSVMPVDLIALGLALFAFPTMWTVGTQAW